MQFVGKVVSTVSEFYKEINPATLSGAIDIVVVERKNGELACSPFHVRFGKLKLLRPQEKVVEVLVNGNPTDLHMKVGDAGEAFFVIETEKPVPEELATSPIQQPTLSPGELSDLEPLTLGKVSDGVLDNNGYVSAKGSELGEDLEPHLLSLKQEMAFRRSTSLPLLKEESNASAPAALQKIPTTIEEAELIVSQELSTSFTTTPSVSPEPSSSRGLSSSPTGLPGPPPPSLSPQPIPLNSEDRAQSISPTQQTGILTSASSLLGRLISGSGTSVTISTSTTSPELTITTASPTTTEQNDEQLLQTNQGDEEEYDPDRYAAMRVSTISTYEDAESGPLSAVDRKPMGLGSTPSANGSGQELAITEEQQVSSTQEIIDANAPPRTVTVFPPSPAVSPRLPTAEIDQVSNDLFVQEPSSSRPPRHSRTQSAHVFSSSASASSFASLLQGNGQDGAIMTTSTTTNSITTLQDRPPNPHSTYPFSDTEIELLDSKTNIEDPTTIRRERVQSPLSDTEIEYSIDSSSKTHTKLSHHHSYHTNEPSASKSGWIWRWGSLPTKDSDGVDISASSSTVTTPTTANITPTTASMPQNIPSPDRKPGSAAPYPTSMSPPKSSWSLLSTSPPPSYSSPSSPPSQSHSQPPLPPPLPIVSQPSVEETTQLIASVSGEVWQGLKDLGGVASLEWSLCGWKAIKDAKDRPEIVFEKFKISYETFITNPVTILVDPNLVIRIEKTYLPYSIAQPVIMSCLFFQKPLTESALKSVLNTPLRIASAASSSSSANVALGDESRKYSFGGLRQWWSRGSNTNVTSTVGTSTSPTKSPGTAVDEVVLDIGPDNGAGMNKSQTGSVITLQPGPLPIPAPPNGVTKQVQFQQQSGSSGAELQHQQQVLRHHAHRYAKSLRLTSEQLKALGLQKGPNTITFSVSTKLQGTQTCTAKIFLWDYDTQVVISDIDGTITKSDALGHLFTMVGRDWTHSGVASLYTNIFKNGYHILYLTSRAIGQANYTREYLKKVEQGQYQLPEGPVFLSPDRLLRAFHREVIARRPEDFKIACLRDIKRLFGDRNPFYAGFGNRITDAFSYRSVDVPASRIFTIDSNGEIKLELLDGYRSSYVKLNDIVDQIFPPVMKQSSMVANGFNDFNFWKPSMPDIDISLAIEEIRGEDDEEEEEEEEEEGEEEELGTDEEEENDELLDEEYDDEDLEEGYDEYDEDEITTSEEEEESVNNNVDIPVPSTTIPIPSRTTSPEAPSRRSKSRSPSRSSSPSKPKSIKQEPSSSPARADKNLLSTTTTTTTSPSSSPSRIINIPSRTPSPQKKPFVPESEEEEDEETMLVGSYPRKAKKF